MSWAHETNNFAAYESITRAHTGEPNVLISRNGAEGEVAAFGDGFYVRAGRSGARGTGFTIRLKLKPEAREGTDFELVHSDPAAHDYFVIKNKNALEVIPESISFPLSAYFKMLAEGKQISDDDKALREKFRRKLNTTAQFPSGEVADTIEIVKANSRNLSIVQEWLSLRISFEHPEVVEKIQKENGSTFLLKAFSGLNRWWPEPQMRSLVNGIIDSGNVDAFHALSRSFFYNPLSVELKGSLSLLIEKGDSETLQNIAQYVAAQPHAEQFKDQIKMLIQRNDPEALQKLAFYGLSGPQAVNQREVLSYLIENGTPGMRQSLADEAFSRPHAAQWREELRQLIERSDERTRRLIAHSVFSKSHISNPDEMIRRMIDLGGEDTHYFLMAFTFTKLHMADKLDLMEYLIEKCNQNNLKYFAEGLFIKPPFSDNPKYRHLLEAVKISDPNARQAFFAKYRRKRGGSREVAASASDTGTTCLIDRLKEFLRLTPR